VSIVSSSSKIFSNIELHETIIKDGVMHMRQVNDLTIAGDQQIT
jgi:copper(I)-binding protein